MHRFLREYSGRPVVLVHSHSFRDVAGLQHEINQAGNVEANLYVANSTSTGYRRAIGHEAGVLVEEGFKRLARNADYADSEDEYFCDEPANAIQGGFLGVGDFLTVGSQYSEGGGAAHAVAIHMTYRNDDGCIWIRHFVSDRTETAADPQGKTLEALGKLRAFVETSGHDFSYSSAVPEWIRAHQTASVPSLATLKRLSLRHHLELVASVI